MLPIERAEVWYVDGSTYTIPDNGTFAEAPPFGVALVCYYHVPDPDGLQRLTVDGGHDNGDVYVWEGEGDYDGIKMGLWQDPEGFYRIQQLATARTSPEV